VGPFWADNFMIKTMKIAAILLAVVAVGALVLAVILGIRPDPERQKVLGQPSVIEQFKKQAAAPKPKITKTPLVVQAEAFKKRIDPPPKPKPVDPNSPGGNGAAARFAPPPPPPPQFEVVATCVNPKDPAKSFALLNQPGKGFFWVKPGDEVSRAVVKQILSGKMVTADGREYLVASTQRVNLLKPGSAMPPGYEKNRASAAAPTTPTKAATISGGAVSRPGTAGVAAVEKSQPVPGPAVAEAPAPVAANPAVTVEEAKANAAFLKQLMENPESMGLTKEEAAQLGDLGQLLKDMNAVDTAPAAGAQDPNAAGTE
jgi:hypothetical protein